MTIEVKGKITHVGTPQVVSEKFTKAEFVVETESGKYPKQVCLQVSQKQLDNFDTLKVGMNVEAEAGINSKEYKGKYYNTIEAFFIKVNKPDSGNAMKPSADFEKPVVSDEDSGLPF